MRYLLILIFFVFSLCLSSQSGFKRQFKVPGAITAMTKAIFETPTGNYIAAGLVYDTVNGATFFRIAIMGLDNQGHLQWTKKYGTKKFNYGNNPFVLKSFVYQDNYLYYGTSALDSNNRIVDAFIKFDLNGDTVWQKTYTDAFHVPYVQMLTKSIDGGFLLTGIFLDTTAANNSPVLLIKTDANGNELWRKKINKNSVNYADGQSILQDSASKKIVITGMQFLGNATNYYISDNVLILDSLGNKLHQLSYMGAYGGVLKDLIQTKDKKFVAVGFQYFGFTALGEPFMRAFAVKFDVDSPNGAIWRINGYDKLTTGNGFGCITELDNSDLLIAGWLDSNYIYNLPTNTLSRLTVASKDGAVKQSMYYNFKTNAANLGNLHSISSLSKTSDKGFVVSIQQDNTPMPNPMFFVKFDSTYCDSSADYCRSRAVGIAGFVIKDLRFRVYPNPSSGILNIDVNAATLEEPLDILLTDALGRTVKQLSLSANTKIDVSDVREGIYFLQVYNAGKLLATEKIIKN